MKKKFCPQCAAQLIEDASEEITEMENGSFVIDAYLAFVCSNRCGYERFIDSPNLYRIK